MPLVAPKASVDPTLASLFQSSGRSVEAQPSKASRSKSNVEPSITSRKVSPSSSSDAASSSASDARPRHEHDGPTHVTPREAEPVGLLKRKRGQLNEDLEDTYMRRMSQLDAREAKMRRDERATKGRAHDHDIERSIPRTSHKEHPSLSRASSTEEGGSSELDESPSHPAHETVDRTEDSVDLERSSRTVFLGNVSVDAVVSKSAKKTLVHHLSSFVKTLSSSDDARQLHKVDSIRFRSTAFSTRSIPKKAAYVRKEVMHETTRSTNAYVVYSTALAAREAVTRLNGSMILDRHLRVDSVAHPAPTDHRRCVFVGNLGFVDDETAIRAASGAEQPVRRSHKPVADVEEGLWRQFGKAGTVESVRVIRDPATRVGKGFAYVQFTDANAVEAALLYHDQKFPPLLPRKLRVVRAKRMMKASAPSHPTQTPIPDRDRVYVTKPSPRLQSLQGRASKLLGRAAAAQLRRSAGPHTRRPSHREAVSGQAVVYEGHRARPDESWPKLQPRRSGAGKGKARVRKRARTTAWKAAQGSSRKPSRSARV